MKLSLTLSRLLVPALLFAGLAMLARSVWFQSQPEAMALGITIDLTITIPIIYFLIIRKTTIHKITIVPVFVLGLVIASVIIPTDHQQTLLQIRNWVLPVVELTAISFIVLKVRSISIQFKKQPKHHFDFFTALKTAASEVLPRPVNILLATELSVFYYGFLHWKKKSLAYNEFSYHKESSSIAVLWAVIMLVLVETAVLHLLLMQWSLLAAWIVSGISVYTGFQVFGMLRSLSKRPIVFEEEVLQLRYGILAEVTLPYAQVESVELDGKDFEASENIRKLSPLGDLESHNVIIKLNKSATISNLYGIKRDCLAIALHVDDKENFKRNVALRIT